MAESNISIYVLIKQLNIPLFYLKSIPKTLSILDNLKEIFFMGKSKINAL